MVLSSVFLECATPAIRCEKRPQKNEFLWIFYGKRLKKAEKVPALALTKSLLIFSIPLLICTIPLLFFTKPLLILPKGGIGKITRNLRTQEWKNVMSGSQILVPGCHFAAFSPFFVLSRFFTLENKNYAAQWRYYLILIAAVKRFRFRRFYFIKTHKMPA